MKKALCICLAALFICLCAAGCSQAKSEENVPLSQFNQYSQSCCTSSTVFELTFFTKAEEVSKWDENNIIYSALKIGNVGVEVEIDSIVLSENLIYETYYMGYMTLNVDLKETSGTALLQIQFADEETVREFDLGNISVLDNGTTNYADVAQMVCGGIVATDEDGNVFTYGVVIHCELLNDITITQIGFGLEDVGVDADACIVYTPAEYANGVRDAIDNTEFDQYCDSAYEKKYVDVIDGSADIQLSVGEYYLYFPIQFTGEDVPALNQGVIVLTYENASGSENTFISSSWPYFTEMSKPRAVLDEMFAAK